jgi:large subunit ribosomal protein L17
MATERKLGRTASQRKAMLRGLTTQLFVYGRIETTEARAKEVRSIADKMITLAAREYDKSVEVEKETTNDKKQIVKVTSSNDAPSKLAARRIMMSYLYDIPEAKKDNETKSEYKERTKDNRHPVIEKMFREYGPKYRGRNGGYTRIVKKGPRRGDAAEMVILELV